MKNKKFRITINSIIVNPLIHLYSLLLYFLFKKKYKRFEFNARKEQIAAMNPDIYQALYGDDDIIKQVDDAIQGILNTKLAPFFDLFNDEDIYIPDDFKKRVRTKKEKD